MDTPITNSAAAAADTAWDEPLSVKTQAAGLELRIYVLVQMEVDLVVECYCCYCAWKLEDIISSKGSRNINKTVLYGFCLHGSLRARAYKKWERGDKP